MPLHTGHCLLIDIALQQCDHVTVCLMSRGDEPLDGEVRLGWLRSLYGETCTIVHHTAELPQDESGYDHWDEYLVSVRTVCPDRYDAVFSSESYGERLANDFEAEHVLVDEARTAVPVSGTAIRTNPAKHMQYLPGIVKTYYETLERN